MSDKRFQYKAPLHARITFLSSLLEDSDRRSEGADLAKEVEDLVDTYKSTKRHLEEARQLRIEAIAMLTEIMNLVERSPDGTILISKYPHGMASRISDLCTRLLTQR